MHVRATATRRSGRASSLRRRPPAPATRPGLLLAVAAAGALLVDVVGGSEPAAQAEAAVPEQISVAAQLGLTASAGTIDPSRDLDPLQDLAVSRSAREAAQAEAVQVQAAADRAELKRQRAEARAAARAEARAKAAAEAAAKEAAAEAAAEQAQAEEEAAAQAAAEPVEVAEESSGGAAAAPAPRSTAVSATAQIANSAGPINPRAQAAADAVVSNVPGAAGIHLGGTRPSATDPGGHPSGNAVDYMVMSDTALGDAIVQYHIANWDALGVEYIIWRQRYLASPGGGWSSMEDRGSSTANHMDHPHVNYRG